MSQKSLMEKWLKFGAGPADGECEAGQAHWHREKERRFCERTEGRGDEGLCPHETVFRCGAFAIL